MNRIFRDEYTDFTFNGVRSSQMKVWITNNKDLQFRLTPEFNDTFLAPSISNTQILNNTNITKSTFSLKCIAIDVTMQDWRAIQGWLSPTTVGRLSFDFNIGTYYNAKIDKGISGTTFVKGGGDRNISDKYIIEFTVGFTTVGDYAALGEVNVGILEVNFGKVDYQGTTSVDDLEYKIESVSNNRYFMPSISKMNTSIPNNKFTKINNKYIKITLGNISGETVLGQVYDFSTKTITTNSDKSQTTKYYAQYSIKYVPTNNVISVIRKKFNESSKENQDFYIAANYTLKEQKSGEQVEKYAIISLFGEELYLLPILGSFSWVKDNYTPYAICNTGSYDMYPSLLLNTSGFIIDQDNEEKYNYNLRFSTSLTVDCQNGFVLSQGQPVENISYKIKQGQTTYDYDFMSSYKNNGILSIKSGRPQIFKAQYAGEVQTIQSELEGNTNILGHIYTFLSPEKLQYDHRNNVALHIFKEVSGMQEFNTLFYPTSLQDGLESSKYEISFTNSTFRIDPRIECEYVDGYYKYFFTILGDKEAINFIANKTYYISICDYEILDIQLTDGNGFIYLQTRDAF